MSAPDPGWCVHGYALLLRLYPARFRAEYGAEMEAVFAQALADAVPLGRSGLATTCWRELRDLPLAVLREHWRERMGKDGPMSSVLDLSLATAPDDGRPGTRREAGLAGLPLAATAALAAMSAFTSNQSALFNVLLAFAGVAGLLAGLAAAWRSGWPRWSASWAFYWLVLATAGLGWAAQALRVMGTQDVYQVTIFGLFALGLPVSLYFVARHDRIGGLLLALPVMMTLWLPVMEFVPNAVRNVLMPVQWLSAALIAYGLVRWGNVRFSLGLMLGLNLLTGLAAAYSRAYLRVYPADAPAEVRAELPTFADFLYWFIPPLVALSTLVIGPILGRALWQLGKLSGGLGMWASRLSITGLLLALAGNFGSLGIYLNSPSPWSTPSFNLFFTGLTYGGLLLLLIGSALFLVSPIRQNKLDRLISGALALVLFGLPFAAALPLWMGFRFQPSDIPFGFLQVHTHHGAAYGAALAWVLAGGGLALYLSRRQATKVEGPPAV